VAAIRDVEAVDFGEIDRVRIAEDFGGFRGFLVPDIADALEEQQRQDIRFPVRAVNGTAAEDLGAIPEVGFEFLKGKGHFKPLTVFCIYNPFKIRFR